MVENEEGGDGSDGWVDTHHYDSKEGGAEDAGVAEDMDAPAGAATAAAPVVQTNDDDDDDEEALDMEDFEESGMMDDQVI